MVRIIIGIAAALCVATSASAEPTKLTESQMDSVTAGVGFNQASEKHAGGDPAVRTAWDALSAAGFVPVQNLSTALNVTVPGRP
jgi:hypothetical protein